MGARWSEASRHVERQAREFARRLAAGETAKAIYNELGCCEGTFRRAMLKAGYNLGTGRLSGQARQQRMAEAMDRERMAEHRMQRSEGKRVAWLCLGCGHELECCDEFCPKCGGWSFEPIEIGWIK
jgi:hypothetical protein